MSLVKKTEELLKDSLTPENIKTVVDIIEYLQFKEKQEQWHKIDRMEADNISDAEYRRIQKLRDENNFISQATLLKELGIEEYEL